MFERQRSLIVTIVILFLVLNVFSIFAFSRYAISKSETQSLDSAKDSILEMVKEKGVCVSDTFDKIESNAELLGVAMENELEDNQKKVAPSDYHITEDNILVRDRNSSKEDFEQSNVIRPNTSKMSQDLIRTINATERLDKALSSIASNDIVEWTYIITKDNFMRCMPYTNLPDYYNDAHAQIKDDFYKIANEENNPDRKIVWTNIYYDYLGKGWMTTCSRPVYDSNDELFAVVSIDVSIKEMQSVYFEDFPLGDTGKVCWADKQGNVIYHSDYQDMTAEQGEKFGMNVFDEEMSGSKEAALEDAFSGKTGITFFRDKGSKMLVYTDIKGCDSVLFFEVDMDEFKASEEIDITGMWIIVGLGVVFIIICAAFLYLYISRPLNRLVKKSERISKGNFKVIEDEDDSSGFYEIASLNQAFKTMNESLEKYTDNLIERNRELSIVMDSIEETLMIADLDGNIDLKSTDKKPLPEEILKNGVSRVIETGRTYKEQPVVGNEVYKNIYYPVFTEGKLTSVVVSSACITKNVLMEKELQQIEKMAGVGQLAAAIVHELKNSLALVNGATYILEMTMEDSSAEVNTIKDAVMDAQNIIDTLLEYSQKDEHGVEPIHIRTMINQILLLAKKEMISKGIEVDVDCSDECYYNSSGRTALKVILQNIILNAIQQFSEEGSIYIKLTEDDDAISIAITDTAGGIKAEDKDSIFEPFVTTKDDGNGIGLWITKQLVESLNGSIRVSEPGEGMTTFTVVLPRNGEEGESDDEGTIN